MGINTNKKRKIYVNNKKLKATYNLLVYTMIVLVVFFKLTLVKSFNKIVMPFVNLNAPLKIVNGAITSSNLIGAFSTSISVDAFNAF